MTAIGVEAAGVSHPLETDSGPFASPQPLKTTATTTPADAREDTPPTFVAGFVVSATARRVVFIYGRNESGAEAFIFLYDLAAIPPDTTPFDRSPIKVANGKAFALALPSDLFSIGVVWVASSTEPLLTAVAGGITATTYTRA